MLRRNLAPHDVVLCAFHSYWVLRTMLAPPGPDLVGVRLASAALLATTLTTIVLVRGEWLRAGPARALFYRLGLVLPLIGTYLLLRRALPALSLPLCDAALLGLDRAILGTTPALYFERFAVTPVVEWFSFYYYAYFAMLAAHLCGALFLDRGRRAAELLLALTLITCVGHVMYSIVPGVGPFAWHGLSFGADLPGGFFLTRVQDAVREAGAGLDIFPSLHTAHPLLLSLHAHRHRGRRPFSVLWPFVVFATANMIVSTMFLRFHYAVDVLAGAALAVVSHRAAIFWLGRSWQRSGAQRCWEELWDWRSGRLLPTLGKAWRFLRDTGWPLVHCSWCGLRRRHRSRPRAGSVR